MRRSLEQEHAAVAPQTRSSSSPRRTARRSSHEGSTPPLLHPGVNWSEVTELGIPNPLLNFATQSAGRPAPLPTQVHSPFSSALFNFHRWIWLQWPWLALAGGRTATAALVRQHARESGGGDGDAASEQLQLSARLSAPPPPRDARRALHEQDASAPLRIVLGQQTSAAAATSGASGWGT